MAHDNEAVEEALAGIARIQAQVSTRANPPPVFAWAETLAAELTRLRASAPKVWDAGSWQPIETVPVSEEVLLLHRYGAIHDSMVNPNGTTVGPCGHPGLKGEYTHWRPRPQPPAGGGA